MEALAGESTGKARMSEPSRAIASAPAAADPLDGRVQRQGHQGPMTRFTVLRRILADLGTPMRSDMKVMDFGCGQGGLVRAALAQGFDAYGCDLYSGEYHPSWNAEWDAGRDPGRPRHDAGRDAMGGRGRIRAIRAPYVLPFEDASIDVIVSDQVFEHVLNYPEAIAELHRVMRPGGCFLHVFPSRYALIEGHIFVPLTTVFRPRWWLWIWALLGVRNEFQRGLSARETVDANAHFLALGTKYLPPREIKRLFARHFERVEFVERLFLPYSIRPRFLTKVPFGPFLYGLLCHRFLYGVRAP